MAIDLIRDFDNSRPADSSRAIPEAEAPSPPDVRVSGLTRMTFEMVCFARQESIILLFGKPKSGCLQLQSTAHLQSSGRHCGGGRRPSKPFSFPANPNSGVNARKTHISCGQSNYQAIRTGSTLSSRAAIRWINSASLSSDEQKTSGEAVGAAFSMALVLCSYCFSSIRSARREAAITTNTPTTTSSNREKGSGNSSWVQQALDEQKEVERKKG